MKRTMFRLVWAVLALVAIPLVRPLNRLRNLTRFGASIDQTPVE